ncbi:MAG TPA: hypothetical protein VGM54_21115 [Chthoniobacter sp.]|jgi:hypothetical protein
MKFAPLFLMALAATLVSCATAKNGSPRGSSGGGAWGSGISKEDALAGSPAASSTASLPPLHGPATGSGNAYFRSLGSGGATRSSAPPSVTGGDEASPQAGLVTGDRVWP